MNLTQENKTISLLIPFIEDFESEALSYCAKPFLGVFTYTHTSSSATCGLEWGESLLDVCNNNRTNLIFDYNLCSTMVAFSGAELSTCISDEALLYTMYTIKCVQYNSSDDTPLNIKHIVFTYQTYN